MSQWLCERDAWAQVNIIQKVNIIKGGVRKIRDFRFYDGTIYGQGNTSTSTGIAAVTESFNLGEGSNTPKTQKSVNHNTRGVNQELWMFTPAFDLP